MTNEPSWTASRAVTGWPVERVELHALAIDLGVPLGWEPEERGTGAPAQIAVHRGPSRAEQVAVQLVEDADESRPLSAWLDAVVTVAGFPVPELLGDGDGGQPDLVEWRDVGAAPGYAERLGADDSHLYDGLAVLTSRPTQLARLYVVLLRARRRAWRLSLSFESACPPGSPSALVEANDHVRAAATFGGVELR